jgi:hypothetical protein
MEPSGDNDGSLDFTAAAVEVACERGGGAATEIEEVEDDAEVSFD